ncbi:putative ribonuclease H-like domain-containing protein [Tanacetum coccineum]
MTAYSLWEVIKNGNKVLKRIVRETEQEYEPTIAEEKQDRRNEMKARGTLLMALPNKDQLKFHSYKDAKLLMEDIEKSNTYSNCNNKNEADNTAQRVSATHTQCNSTSGDNLSDAMICAFLASQPNSPQLTRDDLEQIDPDDLEEMDLQWEMTMLTIRARRFIQRTGRKLDVNGQRVGFDRTKVECYNCHKYGHFARECKVPRNQENRGRENNRRTVTVETPTENALVAQEGQEVRLGSSSSLDYEVDSCSKSCVKAYATLKEQYDSLYSDYKRSQLNLVSYKAGLEPVEARLAHYKKNEDVFEESINVLKLVVKLRDTALVENKKKLEKTEKERDKLKLTLEKFKNSSKSLNNLLESQFIDKFKTGLGYNAASVASPTVESFVNSYEMLENQENNKSKFDKGYHAVPPPFIGNFIPRKPDLTFIDEIVKSENIDVTTIVTPSNVKTGNPQQKEYKEKGVIDSGFSRHMTRNKCYLTEYEDYDGGFADESQVLLRVPRKDNIYSVDLKSVVPTKGLTCLFAKATIDESNLWHRRLGHINFKNMNKLVRGNLVRGLPSKIFEMDISCVVVTTEETQSLYETSGILKTFKTEIENKLDHKVKVIRCDNGTELKNNVMNQFCEMKGIKREFSVARTPQQNGVAERRNRTLIEAARTIFLKNTPNVIGNGPDWLFDVDSLTISMNYVLVVEGNQANGIAGTRDNIVTIPKVSEEDATEKPTEMMKVELQISMGRWIKTHESESRVADADLNNLETTMNTRIDKDHPKDQIIGKFNSTIQTRRMTKISDKHAMMDVKSAFLYGTIDEEVKLRRPYVHDFEGLMHKRFQMSSIGELKNFATVRTASTPIETNKALLEDEEAADVDVHLYRSMIRSLMYLTASRLDIMFAVCACARDSPFDLEASSNSDYAGSSLDRKSTTGAEYVVAANCCRQVLWIQNQLLDYRYNFMNTKIFIDNESTICIVKNPVFHSKTKHIEIRHHFIRDSYEKRLIQVIKIHIDHNVADLLTKAFDKPIIVPSSYPPKNIHKSRKAIRTTEISQSNGPINLVAYETVYKEREDRMERAATTASSLDAEQDSDAQTRFETTFKKSNDPPLSRGYTLRSGEDSMKLLELMELCTKLSDLVSKKKREML